MLPTAASPPNCTSTSGENPTARIDASTPDPTPSMPSMLPMRAVAWVARPDSEPMQSTELTRYPACTRPGAPGEAAAMTPPPKTTPGMA